MPAAGDIVKIRCEVESTGKDEDENEENGEIKVIVKDIEVYQQSK